jgi:hypothetical protein
MAESGFEYQGTFYPWRFGSLGKDLILVDRITGMGINEFYEAVDDPAQRSRTPIYLAMIATSVRAGHPDWSVERIERLILDMDLADVAQVDGDEDEEQPAPLPEPTADESNKSQSNGFSRSSTPPDSSASETLSEIPPSSGSRGSPTISPASPSASSSRGTGP